MRRINGRGRGGRWTGVMMDVDPIALLRISVDVGQPWLSDAGKTDAVVERLGEKSRGVRDRSNAKDCLS